MLWTTFLFSLLLHSTATFNSWPVPPETTEEQRAVLQRAIQKAKQASEEATPKVLDFFNSDGFRKMLQDVVALMHHSNLSQGASPINDMAQKEIFGCKAFAGAVPTWSEVSNRLIYIAHNMQRLDTGSEPFFGDFTVVFNSSRMKDSVLIAPYDTGLYTMVCLGAPLPSHLNKSDLPPLNCSAWPRDLPVGTLEYLDHLILPNLRVPVNKSSGNETVLQVARNLYTRSSMSEIGYEDMPSLQFVDMDGYLESDIMANPRLPSSVKLGIGNFPTLFGTPYGRDVQHMARAFQWPLFWAFGAGMVKTPQHLHPGEFYQMNRRIADPSNIPLTTNASLHGAEAAAAVASFEALWNEAAQVRQSRNATAEDLLHWQLWDLDGRCLRTMGSSGPGEAKELQVTGLEVDWSTRRALTGDLYHEVRLWNLEEGRCMPGHGDMIRGVAVDWSKDLAVTHDAAGLKMSSPHLGHWAVHAGLALVDATSSRRGELLSSRAQSFAKHMGFFDRRTLNVLVVMSAELGVELAGSLFDPSIGEKYFQESTDWLAAEVLCKTKLRAGRFAQAAQAAFDGILKVLTGSTELITSQSHFKQKELAKWKSSFQVGEIWLNMCGDRLCRELVLGDIRQLSEGFERYYHEAMTLPALNLLGEAKKRRVLILGGGDGGIATCALQFSTVEQVVNIDIDAMVTQHAKKWFPQVAAGFNDPRCEAMHTDAFAWVDRHSSSEAKFDLVVIDFTDEPLDGAWSEKFFAQLRGLLTTDGIVVQNAGTIANPQDLHKLFGLHALVFGSTFPMHALIPDYLGPYILVLSSADPKLQPLQADWGFWESQQVATQYYDGPAQHMALFNAIPTDVAQLLGLPLTSEHPTRVTLPLGPLGSSTSRKEKVLFKQKSTEGNLVKVTKETTESLYQEWDAILSSDSWHRDECLILPALSILGSPRSVLVLGGGTGALATLALRWPSVEKLRVVEVDELVVQAVQTYFPQQAKALSDPRTQLIMDNAFSWILKTEEQFDIVILSVFDQPWLPPRRTTRIPQLRGFYQRLQALTTPKGIFVQEAGSIAMPERFGATLDLHRQVFAQSWPLAMSSSASSPQPTAPGDEFDGLYFRPPRLLLLSTNDPQLDPARVSMQHWQGFADSGAPTTYYHPHLHRALFVLPLELQRRFEAFPPWHPEPSNDFLIEAFMMQAHGCSADSLNNVTTAGTLMKNIADLAELTALGGVEHKFEPQGLTALLLVFESHLSIHTWPEFEYAALDVVSCKDIPPRARKAIEQEVSHTLGCHSVVSHFSLRGRGIDPNHLSMPADWERLRFVTMGGDAIKTWVKGQELWSMAVHLWNLATGQLLWVFRHHLDDISGFCVNWEKQQSASWGEDGLLLLWDLETGKLLEKMPHQQAITETTCAGHRVGHMLTGHRDHICKAEACWDQDRALSWSDDATLRLWDLRLALSVVCLLSGEVLTTSIDAGVSIEDLRFEIQRQIGSAYVHLTSGDGVKLRGAIPLSEAGLKDGDQIYVVVPGHVRVKAHKFGMGFAAIKPDGSAIWISLDKLMVRDGPFQQLLACASATQVVCWGDPDGGGHITPKVKSQLQGVKHIVASVSAFAAIRQDGEVVTWGDPDAGGNSEIVQAKLRKVKRVYTSKFAFAAVREDGTVVTWGPAEHGGDSSSVESNLTGVHHIEASKSAFAAISVQANVDASKGVQVQLRSSLGVEVFQWIQAKH
eukprot:g31695.t1